MATELIDTTLFDDASLISYWRFEGDSSDSKDSNNGSDTNITYNATSGIFNQKAIFNGTNSKIALGDPDNLSLNSDLTIMAWINIDDIPSTNNGCGIFGKGSVLGGSAAYWFLFANEIAPSSVKGLRFGATSDGSSAVDKEVTWNASADTWYMVTAVYTKSAGSVKFYVNDSQQGTTQTGLPTSLYTGGNGFIGSFGDGANYFMDGFIDELAVFSRALSATEIANHYTGADASPKQLGYSYFL